MKLDELSTKELTILQDLLSEEIETIRELNSKYNLHKGIIATREERVRYYELIKVKINNALGVYK
ncbi:hypothetical protein [Cytobacillus gottheilii]|uniref:hypothetical protein n=1 Tax=Cytobacillus gottheilii TaxID=859144 RepID=UPI0009BB0E02|nr:hypothetical protein [Cytobacillus gottheilii]